MTSVEILNIKVGGKMVEQEGKQALMIQLPWTVPQQPLVTTQIQVDTTTQKIPLEPIQNIFYAKVALKRLN